MRMMTTSNEEWTHTYLKPLSSNQAFCGKKVKTASYRKYEAHLIRTLPKVTIPKDGPLELRVVVYYSNTASDLDNALKSFIDVLQKKYNFNDNRIYRLRATKVIVPKGEENIAFKFLPFTPNGEHTYGTKTQTDEEYTCAPFHDEHSPSDVQAT